MPAMAAREPIPFQTAFDQAIRPTGLLTSVSTDATLKATMLALFNRSYKIGYQLPWESGSEWEDARTWAEITPTAGLIAWDVIGDARQFDIYTLDPRESRLAERVTYFTDSTGIEVGTAHDTVWVSWLPATFKFTTTAWVTATAYAVGDRVLMNDKNYRCLVAHTSGTFATDLAASKWVLMPVLDIMEEFLIRHVQGTYLVDTNQIQTGTAMQRQAYDDLLELHRAELRRNREQTQL